MTVSSPATEISETSVQVTREHADDHDRVVDRRERRARRVPDVEPEREVQHDQEDRVDDRLGRVVAQLVAGLRADAVAVLDSDLGVRRAPSRGAAANWRSRPHIANDCVELVGAFVGRA